MIGKLDVILSIIAASVTHGAADANRGETITYSHHPGGLCPNFDLRGCTPFTITIGPDGSGVVLSLGRNPRTSSFPASSAEAQAFRARLQPYRHPGDRGWTCRPAVTDGDTIEVTWSQAGQIVARLEMNGGCSFPGKEAMWKALASAPSLLPIADRLPPH